MSGLSHEVVGEFIDAVVQNPATADAMLIERPDLLNARWIHEETVLHFLAIEGFTEGVRRAGHAELVRRLVKAGANARYRTHRGETVFDAVNENTSEERQETLAVLREHEVRDPEAE